MTDSNETRVRARVLGGLRSTWIAFVTFNNAPEVRVRFKNNPTAVARYRCDQCGEGRNVTCPHAAAAVATIRLQIEAAA